MSKRGGLGRGLAALIPTSAPPEHTAAAAVATQTRDIDMEAPGEERRVVGFLPRGRAADG